MADSELTLETLGWDPALERDFAPFRQNGLEPGRVAVEDKHYYVVITPQGDLTGQVTGKLLHQAHGPSDLPKVGDWVVLSRVPGETKAVIHHVLERRTWLSRKVTGREIEEQVLVTNIDTAFAVQALDNSFNPALVQRHMVMICESGAEPVIVLNKADLCDSIPEKVDHIRKAAGDAPIIVASGKTGAGVEALAAHIRLGKTAVFIGSSGVGKSTLINDLCGEVIQATAEVRERDAKGRHTTTWRELIVLPQGGLVIDTPGMREFHMWLANEGMREAFADLDLLATQCHFRDCTHTVESRCAVLQALAGGQVPRDRYERFVKLQKELVYLQEAHTKHGWMQRRKQTRLAQRTASRAKI
jgi:ribosome biogenesis GTPase / thiamine phosphate phosphatase